jgi:ribosomal protein L44E
VVDGKNVNNMKIIVSKEDKKYIEESIKSGEVLFEDLRRWFKEKWVDVSKKVDGKHPPCGRKDADGKSYPKCRPSKKVSKETPKVASSYDKDEKKSMTTQKRRAEKKEPKIGKGNKPTMVRFDEQKDMKINCDGCDWSWNLSEGGNDPYVCHKCGKDNSKKYKKMTVKVTESQYVRLNFNNQSPKLVNENVVISDGLKYQLTTKKTLVENIYKIGTEGYNRLIEECRELYENEDLDLFGDDIDLIYEDELGSVEDSDIIFDETLSEAEYQGRNVQLGKIMQGDIKKFKVYVKNDKGKVVKVNFGFGGKSAKGKRMVIKKNNPERRKSFRARMKCDTPGPRWKPRYWACKTW